MKSSKLARGLIAAAVVVCVSLGATATADASGSGVPDSKISVQLWTFAEYIEFGNNIPRTEEVFRRLREMGYRNVEPFSLGGLTAKQYRALLDKHRLKASARHVDVGTPQNPANIDQIIADNKTLGLKYFGSGGTPQLKTEAEWVAYARYLDGLGAKARRAGQQLMVHNHNWEFETKFGNKTAFDVLMANTDERNVAFQLDLYWVTFGGGDPIAVLKRYGKRIKLFHVKDMREGDRRIEIVGRGIIDFQRIFEAGGGIDYYVVEHDPRFDDPTFDPFEAAEVGFDYLKDPSTAKPRETSFQKVVIDATPGEPMDLAVLPDGKALHVERSGEVWMHNPANGLKTLAATIDVYEHDEEGLQSIALDPNFASNRWVYLYYSPPLNTPTDNPDTPTVNEGDAPFTGAPADFAPFKGHIQLSRFKWTGSTINLGSEQKILQVPVDRGICCHVGGDIVFDKSGNLILATGDDTNPFESDGYAPIDERPTRNPAFDAQRTSANTNDLRGKVLRVRVGANGGYSIPPGNLFVDANQQTRPEIYAMGLRNPFRIEYNRRSGELYVADYSPDASSPTPARGPAGQGKWTIVTAPGNFGWPYCATAELPYVDYDFGTGASGAPFNCAAPVNASPHNTGVRELPQVTQPDVWYSYAASAQFPELGTGGIGPMAGPAYVFDEKLARKKDSTAWPRYYDNVPLFYEWTRDYIKAFFTRGGERVPDRASARDVRLRQPDRPRVRSGRRVVRARVRRRLLRQEPAGRRSSRASTTSARPATARRPSPPRPRRPRARAR